MTQLAHQTYEEGDCCSVPWSDCTERTGTRFNLQTRFARMPVWGQLFLVSIFRPALSPARNFLVATLGSFAFPL